MSTVEESVTLLGQVPVFETLAPEDLQHVAEVAVPRSFAPHQVIFREGDNSDTCYVVRSGHARAMREHIDGRTLALAGSDMRRLLRQHPDIAVKLVISLGRRLRDANERLARQSFQTVQSLSLIHI